MPELPEVEAARLSFVDKIAGAEILSVQLGKPLRWPLGCCVAQLVGRTVRMVRRRGKYLLIDLDQGLILVHLGMSGSLSFMLDRSPMGPHDHFEMVTSRGVLRLNDPRRFGAVVFTDSEQSVMAHKLLGALGMEPLTDGFDLSKFQVGLKSRKAAIKQVLLAGDLVVGVGNIYASEVLFLSGIRPTLRAAQLSRVRAARLHTVIREVLARAIALGGSTLRNFTNANGENGHFQVETKVYGRAGLPCQVCGSTIKTIKQGQRSTFYCQKCQKR